MKLTADQLAKKLGLSRATVFTLKRHFPKEAPQSFSEVRAWRTFASRHVTDPEAITRLAR
jgi:predicted DNA-binding transcriptional regulator AlpA